MIELAITTTILGILFGFNLYTNYFHYKHYLALVIFNIFISYLVYLKSNIPFAIFILYCLSNASHYILYTKPKHFAHPQGGVNHNLISVISKSYLTILICSIFFCWLDVNNLILSLKTLHIINIVLTLIPAKYTYFKTEAGESKSAICGFGANVSTNATLLSLMSTTFLINFNQNIYLNIAVLSFTLIAILKTTASVGLISFLFSIIIFITSSSTPMALLFLVMAVIMTSITAIFIMPKIKPRSRLFSVSGRDNLFRFTNKWIRPRIENQLGSNKHFGMGIGSFGYVFPSTFQKMQEMSLNQFKIANYIWMHCDLYQFYLEGGLVGILLGSVAFLYAVYLCIINHNYAGLSFLGSYLLNSLGNFPNHLIPDIVTIVIMFNFICNYGQ